MGIWRLRWSCSNTNIMYDRHKIFPKTLVRKGLGRMLTNPRCTVSPQKEPKTRKPPLSCRHCHLQDQMASHHHHCQHHHAATCSCSTTIPSHQSPPLPPPLDPLLQALASQILLQQSPQLHHAHYSPYLRPNASHHQIQYQDYQHHKMQQFQHHHHQQQQDHQTHTITSSLLKRIDALESSLYRLSSSSYSSPYRRHSSSIRDVAARTIQTHFRAFLVRRSRTLRNLKDLAIIKSAFITLKSCISDETYIDPESLYRKVMDLLLELDSVQGGDPMIRDGKRTLSRDLVRFLDFIDGVSVKRHEILTKSVNNVRFVQNRNKSKVWGTNCRGLGSRDQREIMDKLRAQARNVSGYARVSENDEEEVELEGFHHGSDDEQSAGVSNYRNSGIFLKRHGVQSRVKKCVSFAENGNAARVFGSRNGAASFNGVPRNEGQRELLESLCRDVEEIGTFSRQTEDDEETHIESGGSDQISDSEENPRRNSGAEGNYEISGLYQGENGNLIFSAPVPVKMESRAELIRRERVRKIEEES